MRISYLEIRYLVIVLLAAAAAIAVYAVASAPSRVASRLGMRGLKRLRALEKNEQWRSIEPLVRWLGVRVSGILTDDQRKSLDKQLSLAGDFLGITAEEYVGLSILSFIGGVVFGVIAGWLTGMGVVMLIIVAPLGGALPYLQVSSAATLRMKQINRNLPYAVDLLALAMSAGKDFPGAVRQVVEKSSDPDDALIEEFSRMLQELGIGRTRKQALLGFAERAPIETVQEFVNSVVQAEEKGNPLADVLQIQAGMSRMRRSVRAEQAAAKAGVQMIGPLALLLLCIIALILGPMFLKLAASGGET
ncbi:MAG: type II secretion system F family protein [Polyangiaceae bacterium]|nr:type II secretion system F family protein [Polyangiaceae bacterium]MCK6535094.1 type II secretion system F family protein [Polyangiaceae bacterium]